MTRRLTLIGIIGLLLSGCVGTGEARLEPTASEVPPTPTVEALPTDDPTQPPQPPAPTPLLATEMSAPTAAIESPADGANADVTFVRASQQADDTWTFAVTVAHPDTGWEDYADGWDVVLPDGSIIKPDPDSPFTRLLLHPHVDEQPFTRSQSGIVIPEGVTEVTVRAHDLVDGYGGREVKVDLTVDSGPDFEIQRPS